jgi:hypothetical protein
VCRNHLSFNPKKAQNRLPLSRLHRASPTNSILPSWEAAGFTTFPTTKRSTPMSRVG